MYGEVGVEPASTPETRALQALFGRTIASRTLHPQWHVDCRTVEKRSTYCSTVA